MTQSSEEAPNFTSEVVVSRCSHTALIDMLNFKLWTRDNTHFVIALSKYTSRLLSNSVELDM